MHNNNANRNALPVTQNDTIENDTVKISSELDTIQDELINSLLSLKSEVVQHESEENTLQSFESERNDMNDGLDFDALPNQKDV